MEQRASNITQRPTTLQFKTMLGKVVPFHSLPKGNIYEARLKRKKISEISTHIYMYIFTTTFSKRFQLESRKVGLENMITFNKKRE